MKVFVDLPMPTDVTGTGVREDALELLSSATDLVRESWDFEGCKRGPLGDLTVADVLVYDSHRKLVIDQSLDVLGSCARLCESLGGDVLASVIGTGDSVRIPVDVESDTGAGPCAVSALFWAVSAFGEVANSDVNAMVLDVRRVLASLANLLSGDVNSDYCVHVPDGSDDVEVSDD